MFETIQQLVRTCTGAETQGPKRVYLRGYIRMIHPFLFLRNLSRVPAAVLITRTLYPRGTSTPTPHSRYHIPIRKFYKKMNSKVREIYTEIWKLHKSYYDTQSDAEWERLIGETEKVLQRYGRNKFAVKLAEAMISEIESRQK